MLLDDEKQRAGALAHRGRRLRRRVKVRLAEYSLSLSFAMPDSRKLLAGASGYSFKEWKGTFYPEKMKPEEMLAFYSERLPTVEINNTFYQMPKARCWRTGRAPLPRPSASPSRRRAASRTCRASRPTARPIPWPFSIARSPRSGESAARCCSSCRRS
jgi:hypothetical protein